ncbi:MAG TPA: BlaI/MecI/CopY family transcriptional regulator [Bacteroidales bacterium]|nr:BlaI/MecI/CopY family transcriptional regulator [Bacteroidales bacterium]
MNSKPTEAELEILQVLWKDGPSTVRAVNEQLNKMKKVGYTTTLKILQIMTEKHLVERDEKNRTHIYRASVGQKETLGLLLDKFLNKTFDGSASRMMMHLLGNHKASAEEIEEIRKLLENIEKENRNGNS